MKHHKRIGPTQEFWKHNVTQGNENNGLKETMSIACWYLWWPRRRLTHNEAVPTLNHYNIFILTMAANYAKGCKPQVFSDTSILHHYFIL